ncbi:MAG: YraN family protein [Nitrospirae bacterium]|nr:MAG: YraN family protein [Nitrospirota bacterium]
MNKLGRDGEEAALVFLKKTGYTIIDTNYKTVFGEVDIIARDRGVTVFIEVKARSSIAFGHPFEAVTRKKQEKLKKLALFYMKQKKKELPLRFDVLSINISGGKTSIDHIRDAFEV